MFKRWKRYDPSWLVKASDDYFEEYPWLKGALEKCVKCKHKSDLYIYFTDAKNPNKNGSAWQFQESITIVGTPQGDIVIDVIRNNQIGGIEFLTKVLTT